MIGERRESFYNLEIDPTLIQLDSCKTKPIAHVQTIGSSSIFHLTYPRSPAGLLYHNRLLDTPYHREYDEGMNELEDFGRMASLQAVLGECGVYQYVRSADIERAVKAIAEITKRTLEENGISYVDDFNVQAFVR